MLTLEDLKQFAAVSGRCLTIFEPLRQERSRARKSEEFPAEAIGEVNRILGDNGFGEREREETLHPLRDRKATPAGVALQTTGDTRASLVVFRSRSFGYADFWPDALPPLVHAGRQFLVLPLLRAIVSHRNFHLLTLATSAVRLYRGSPESLTEVRLPCNVPRDAAEAGGDLERYFQAIDRGLRPLLLSGRQPLILAGVTRELSIYGCLNTYSPILEQAIHGCPEQLSRRTLHARASALAALYATGAPDKALRDKDDAAGRELLATDTEEIREAAELGRVEHLMLPWPICPAEAQGPPAAAGTCASSSTQDPLNSAALATVRHAGRISVLDPRRLPSGASAILRFRENPALCSGPECSARETDHGFRDVGRSPGAARPPEPASSGTR